MRVIANPPIGIYTNNKTHIGHAFFLVMLDVVARYRSKFLKEDIIFPSKSYNVYGKMGDKIFKDNFSFKLLDSYCDNLISQDYLREKLNLSSSEVLTDKDPEISEGIKSDFLSLLDSGYAFAKGGKVMLDCSKIKKEKNLKEVITHIRTIPKRIQSELERLIDNNLKEPIPISRPTQYSIQNPIGGENIGPLFTLANLWDHKYPGATAFTIAGSNKVLSKYVFLRVLTRISLDQNPGMDEIIIWPQITPEGGINNWDLESLTKEKYQSDMLRCNLMSVYSTKHQRVNLPKDRTNFGISLVYLTSNLSKIIDYQPENLLDSIHYPDYQKEMNQFEFPKVLITLKENLGLISQKINLLKDVGKFNSKEKNKLSLEYSEIINKLDPFIPEISASIRKTKNG